MGYKNMYVEDFALRLSRLRVKKGVSARDMSISIGQNPGYINNIETGKNAPSLEGIHYICDYFGITPAEFFETDSVNPVKINEILKDMKNLTDDQLDAIAVIIKNFKKK